MVRNQLALIIFRLLTNISDLAIVLNIPSKEFVKRYCRTPVSLIPNFIEKSAVFEENKRNISEQVQRVLYVGGVIESKGCCDIIKVAKNFPQIQFRLVGKAHKKIKNMEKPSNVILLGERNKLEVKKELVQADLFIFLTYFPGEGFSNALAEAMASGLPCIASDWAANKDMIEDKGGIIVPIKDIDSVIKALRYLSNNIKARTNMSNWNIKKVKECYIDEVVTDMYVDSYESITCK